MFEKLNFPSIYIATQAVLSLYGGGAHTGLVIESGEGATHCVPIYEGYALSHSIQRMDIAGKDITENLMQSLMTKHTDGQGLRCIATAEREIVRCIKEQCGSVSLNLKQEMEHEYDNKEQNTEQYELPDGQVLSIGIERFKCAEIMFNPEMMGIDSKGIHELAYNSIESCDLHLKKRIIWKYSIIWRKYFVSKHERTY